VRVKHPLGHGTLQDMTRWQEIARAGAGEAYAEQYAERFRRLAARGSGSVHGEADLVAGLVPAPARVLDAGCGTGRVAIRLHELGYDVVGVDLDASMLAMARRDAPDLSWQEADLSTFDLGRTFDVVLVAGNTVPLLEPGTLLAVATGLAAHLDGGGRLVCGFGLDPEHLPGGCPVTPLAEVDDAFAAAGLEPVDRWSSWDRTPFTDPDGYVVTVHTSRLS
jgi:SAM-dependent methyltransferase